MTPRSRGDRMTTKHESLGKNPVVTAMIDLLSPSPPPPPPPSIAQPTWVDLTIESSGSSDDEPRQPRTRQQATTQHPSHSESPRIKRSNTPVGNSTTQILNGNNSSSRRERHISQRDNSTIKTPSMHTKSPSKRTATVTPVAESEEEDEEELHAGTPSRSSARRSSAMNHSRHMGDSVEGTSGNSKPGFTNRNASYNGDRDVQSNDIPRSAGRPSKRPRRNSNDTDTSNSQYEVITASSRNRLPRLEDSDDDEDMQSQSLPEDPKISGDGVKSPVDHNSQTTTINSSSPLLVRLKQRILKKSVREEGENSSSQKEDEKILDENMNKRPPVTVSLLVESLRGFKQSMEENQALATRWILQDTNQASLDRTPLFTDAVSPFASMEAFPFETDDEIESVSYWVNKAGKSGRSKVIVHAKHVESSGLPRVPKYTSHTILRRNVLTADDEKLRFLQQMPEFEYTPDGDAKLKQFVKETQEMYNTVHFTSGREAEGAQQLREYLDSWLEELDIGCNQDTLRRYALGADLDSTKPQIPMKRKDKIRIIESLGGRLRDRDAITAKAFCLAFDKVFNIRSKLYDWSIITLLFSDERSKDMLQSGPAKPSHISPKSSSAQRNQTSRLETYAALTCMICGAIACQTHGDYTTQKATQSSESSDDDDDDDDDDIAKEDEQWVHQHQLLVLTHKDMIRRHKKRIAQGLTKEKKEPTTRRNDACSDLCFKIDDLSLDDYCWVESRLSEFLTALPEMLLSHTNPDNRSCHIAFAWDIPCLLVYDEIRRYERNHEPQQPLEHTPLSRPKRPDWYNNKSKTLKGDWADLTKAHLHEKRAQANPCTHDGPCTHACSCVEANILCESFCGCPDDCPRRFTGCACSSNGITCASETCICVQMNRECGPECVSCGAIPRIDPSNRYNDNLFATGCKNVGLQRGVSKKMLMGESEIPGAGFGLFTGEPIKKGDFLGEYGGEIISGTEAERRGLTYDRKISSFLFDLNSDWVVDAARIGNKTRFINHGATEKEGQNCVAKIVLVNGEHRIKFNATKDIDIGTELLFDYGPTFAEKHGLNKRPVQMLKNNATGYAKKGSMKARKSGGSRGGRGASKSARKTGTSRVASPAGGRDEPPLVLPPDDDEDDDDFRGPQEEEDEEESDNELEQKRVARRRRQIMRPARYTR